MLRPDQALRDRPARVAESAMQELAVQCMRVNRLPIMSEWGIPNYSMGPFNPGLQPAIVTEAITQAASGQLGSGKVQLYYVDDGGHQQPDPDGDDGAGNTAVSNWWTSSGTIATGVRCFVSPFSNVVWLIVWQC
jgi:hypothetical protein